MVSFGFGSKAVGVEVLGGWLAVDGADVWRDEAVSRLGGCELVCGLGWWLWLWL